MIRKLRNSRFLGFFTGFMAMYLLNICVDLPDQLPSNIPEDLSFNDQESMIEIFIEQVLGYEDAIPEHDDNDPSQKTTIKSNTALDTFVLPFLKSKFDNWAVKARRQNNSFYLAHIPACYLEIHSPPPES